MIEDQCLESWNIPLSVFQSGLVATTSYLLFQFIIHHLLPGVSHPGGPREHKIQRVPKWENTFHDPPSIISKKWRAVVAKESHDVTQARYKGTKAQLTGEPSGRQMWTNAAKKEGKVGGGHKVDEKLVMELALGGRKPGFNPSTNPNR